jgi:diketogulonate reductase-like aldo/keto reductase
MRGARSLLFAVPSLLGITRRSSALMTTAAAANALTLNDGRKHPLIGYGTYKVGFIPASASSAAAGDSTSVEVSAAECVEMALDVGYRFLDCAEFYNNEAEVGKAIAKSGVPREELYLASKCWTTTIHKGPEAVQAQLETLKDLGTDYIDLYCIHWPVPGKHVAAYQQLEKAQQAGLVRSLGVSNYAVEDFEELMAGGASVVPAINQIEINPFLHRAKTTAFFESKGVKMQSYRSLRDGKAFDDPTVVAVAAKHGRTAAQVLGRWCVQHGYIYIPKSVKRPRMEENMNVFDFELDADDMQKLDALTTPEALAKYAEVRATAAAAPPNRVAERALCVRSPALTTCVCVPALPAAALRQVRAPRHARRSEDRARAYEVDRGIASRPLRTICPLFRAARRKATLAYPTAP